jgi:hypothetical protein
MKGKLLLVLFCIIFAQLTLAETEITVTEEDFVNLSVTSEDPDNEQLIITFTEPVNNRGVWQTKVGDAGSYTINVSACDREFCDSSIVRINVLAKKFPPKILSYSPRDLNFSIKEKSFMES